MTTTSMSPKADFSVARDRTQVVLDELAATAVPTDRAAWLCELAHYALHRAAAARGNVRRTALDLAPAESLAREAALYVLLADVELAVANRLRGRQWRTLLSKFTHDQFTLNQAIESVLSERRVDVDFDDMASLTDLAKRQQRLGRIYYTVRGTAGRAAAERILHIPAPGMVGDNFTGRLDSVAAILSRPVPAGVLYVAGWLLTTGLALFCAAKDPITVLPLVVVSVWLSFQGARWLRRVGRRHTYLREIKEANAQ